MFFANFIQNNSDGQLAKVWLAAHWVSARRIQKAAIVNTDISAAVDRIIAAPAPIALRIASLLLWGASRILSKQADYLLLDSKGAFRMTESSPAQRDSNKPHRAKRARDDQAESKPKREREEKPFFAELSFKELSASLNSQHTTDDEMIIMRSSQKKMGREEDISLLVGADAEDEAGFVDSAEVALGSGAEVDLSVEIPRRGTSAISEEGAAQPDSSEKMARLEMESASEEELRLLERSERASLRKRRFLVFDASTRLSKEAFKVNMSSWADEMRSAAVKSAYFDFGAQKSLSGPVYKRIASLVLQNKAKESLVWALPTSKKGKDESWAKAISFDGEEASEKNDSFGEGEDEMAAEGASSALEDGGEIDRLPELTPPPGSALGSEVSRELESQREVKLGRRAVKVIAKLQKAARGEVDFDELTRGCSRKAVAGIFFELLAMQSNSMVQCEQETPDRVIVRLCNKKL